MQQGALILRLRSGCRCAPAPSLAFPFRVPPSASDLLPMLFNSLAFCIFFPLVVAGYFLTPPRARWAWLLAASYVFYAWWKIEYTLLLAFSTLVDYGAARAMGRHATRRGRRPYLLVSLGVNLGVLVGFKYLAFFSESLGTLLHGAGMAYAPVGLNVLLPVGISFYTFQTMAYSIDVYRGAQAPEKHLGRFALYVSFFPQLVAGPIERSTHLLPQFREKMRWNDARVASGLQLMLWGFFKKLVIADRLALYVNEVYAAPGAHAGWPVVLATYFFAFQIYCDFSGYCDIAVGAARVMGYDLRPNFRFPYFATSVADFWRRWHISLSTWFRDYLYLPLGGNRVRKARWAFNILVVFLVSGLWHGAAWTFVVWGAIHGLYLLAERAWQGTRAWLWSFGAPVPTRPGWHRWLAALVTFHLVLVAWVFFRASTFDAALHVFASLVGSANPWRLASINPFGVVLSLAGVGVLLAVMARQQQTGQEDVVPFRSRAGRWLFHAALAASLPLFGVFEEIPFIYFQF